MIALISILLLSWLLLGFLRAAATIALNGYVRYGLTALAAHEVWNGFLQPSFLRWSLVLILAASSAAFVATLITRALGVRTAIRTWAVAIAALGAFWLVAGAGELLDRTPIRDVITSDFVISKAQIGILAVAAVAFLLAAATWWALARMQARRTLALTAWAVAATAIIIVAARLGGPADAGARTPRPNVLLISIDTLRADHLSSYGYPRKTTPRLDAFAASGVLYENSISQAPNTHPSMAAMLTSVYPTDFTGGPFKYVPYGPPTIAEVLRNAGYRTGAVVSNVWLKSGLGFDQGFEDYDQTSAMSEFYGDTDRVHWKNASAVSDAGIAYLQHHKDDRFFLWLHYLDPHHPYEPVPPYDSMFAGSDPDQQALVRRLKALSTDQQTKLLVEMGNGKEPVSDHVFQAVIDQYDGEIAYNDAQVGRVLDALERLGLDADTLVVVTADHGEEFRDHGQWGHGHSLYRELVHVPLIVRYPGEAGGRRISSTVRTIDIAPTIIAAAGLPVPASMRGADLRRVPDETTGREAVSVGQRSGQLSVERDGWKFVTAGKQQGPKLFHVATDPRELKDDGPEQPQRVAQMISLLKADVGTASIVVDVGHVTGIDAATRKQLQALGYIN